MVAGGFEGPPRRLFCVVLAMILDSGEFGGRNEAVRFEVEQTKRSKRKGRVIVCYVRREPDWLNAAKEFRGEMPLVYRLETCTCVPPSCLHNNCWAG